MEQSLPLSFKDWKNNFVLGLIAFPKTRGRGRVSHCMVQATRCFRGARQESNLFLTAKGNAKAHANNKGNAEGNAEGNGKGNGVATRKAMPHAMLKAALKGSPMIPRGFREDSQGFHGQSEGSANSNAKGECQRQR